MAHGLLMPLMITLVLGNGAIWADAAIVVDQAAQSLSSRSTNRRSLRPAATTAQHLLRATSHVARPATSSPDPAREASASSSSAPTQPLPALLPDHLIPSAKPSPATELPAHLWTEEYTLTEEWLQLQRSKTPARSPSPPVHLTVSLTAGVAFQARTTPSPALLRGFGAEEEDCGRMAALVASNLTAAAATVGVRLAALPAVERCDGTWFSMRVAFGIESSDCGALSDEIYRDLPRWVNAALGRAPEAAVTCGGAAVGGAEGEEEDGESFTTAWAYGSGEGAARNGCVALAYAHVC